MKRQVLRVGHNPDDLVGSGLAFVGKTMPDRTAIAKVVPFSGLVDDRHARTCLVPNAKSRPAVNGVPNVSKYAGATQFRSVLRR